MSNIINAIIEVVKAPKHKLKEYSTSHNRANQMGAALEDYVKDIFAGTVGESDIKVRNHKISYLLQHKLIQPIDKQVA